MSKRKITLSCMYNGHTNNQDDYLIVSETKKGVKFKIVDKLNKAEVTIKLPMDDATKVGSVIGRAMNMSTYEEIVMDNGDLIRITDAITMDKYSVQLMIVDIDNAESIRLTIEQSRLIREFIRQRLELYKKEE
ncbi:hypothetical protein BCPG3_062 [Bacillus phage BCPG3]|uniref:Uncharacterized protein n=2 Tax=Wphvirus BPS13 TaxID=1987727 RepID=A0A173GBH8_9CAUD|nr:hypothetical protein BPS13_0049 [Bacillus phage BPS13]YP_009281980.1 hypothetical protein SALINJAH_26 [Bacillus phage SalinJah]QQO38940.1 hypothetical protein BCPG1_209 [Bacillus phage BCPG1]QSJ04379.1 hypothetical protein BCPG3_062 [Bacillus phage BCPG3]QSJ04592.1 hypothetical protein BCP18_060 [Bacillus phage BCP18]AEZ50228.1 hypothetical protein BPS13_0049 [Bacillus phage BPS13]ANH50672.1 hypothetical protein SALINJAH_26 [Bacillus phage SalinJah]